MLRSKSERWRKTTASPLKAGRKALALTELCILRPLSEPVIDEIDPALTAFLQAAESRVRTEAALKLAKCDWAPKEAVRALAFDSFEIAGPILEQSTQLIDQDLHALAGLSAQHRLALARRKSINAKLCAVLSQHRELLCLYALADNPGAELSAQCASDFAALAKTDQKLQDALAGRGDLPTDFAQALYDAAGESVRALVEAMSPETFQEELESLAVSCAAPFADTGTSPSLDTLQDSLTQSLQDSGELSPSDALRAVQNGRSDIADHAISRLTGMNAADWRQALRRSPVRAILLAARAMAMPTGQAKLLYGGFCDMGRCHGLDPDALIRATADVYDQYSRDNARQALHRMGVDSSIH